MFVCMCRAVTDTDVRRAVDDGVSTLEGLGACLGAGVDCGSCHNELGNLLQGKQRRKDRSSQIDQEGHSPAL